MANPNAVNQSQRVVLVIGFGIAMLVAGVMVTQVLYDPFDGGLGSLTPGGGLTSTDSYFVVASDSTIIGQGAIALGALAIWTAVSWRILRSPDR